MPVPTEDTFAAALKAQQQQYSFPWEDSKFHLFGSNPEFFVKLITVAVVFFIISWFNNHLKQKNLQNKIQLLDSGETITFKSEEDCVKKGYCVDEATQSYKNAMKIANSVKLSYSSEEACRDKHVEYERKINITINNGSKPQEFNHKARHTRYEPKIVGWQAKKGEILVAVPLYSSRNEGMAVRYDGNTLQEIAFR